MILCVPLTPSVTREAHPRQGSPWTPKTLYRLSRPAHVIRRGVQARPLEMRCKHAIDINGRIIPFAETPVLEGNKMLTRK